MNKPRVMVGMRGFVRAAVKRLASNGTRIVTVDNRFVVTSCSRSKSVTPNAR